MQIEFGKTWREKFGYLIITGIFMFFSSMLLKVSILYLGLVGEDYFREYEMFYNILGAVIGFMFAQVFIRLHMRAARRGGF